MNLAKKYNIYLIKLKMIIYKLKIIIIHKRYNKIILIIVSIIFRIKDSYKK